MRPIIYPYKMGSKSARALSRVLRPQRCKRVRPDGRYRPYRNHLIINWGHSGRPNWVHPSIGQFPNRWLNSIQAVSRASNKLSAYRILDRAGVSIPPYTTDAQTALQWLRGGDTVLARTLLRANGGRGIEILENEGDIIHAPLYTKYMKKKHEYRVHVFNGEVLDIQHKRKRRGTDGTNFKVRNHNGGWVFARGDIINPHPDVITQSLAAVEALELDFGAVDIGWNEKHKLATVYEVNCAPGIEGTTLVKYTRAIINLL